MTESSVSRLHSIRILELLISVAKNLSLQIYSDVQTLNYMFREVGDIVPDNFHTYVG